MRVATIVLALLVCSAPPARAWEADVHYGLTKWLALKAGFSEADAEAIARGDADSDKGIIDAVHLVAWYACAERDEQASVLVRNRHFPTLGKVPSLAKDRIVMPNGPAAKTPVDEIVGHTRTQEADAAERASVLARLGAALHALQDSWSHQGTPDPPGFICDAKLGWGHPKARGGLWQHKADLTPEWREDTLAMAEATFNALRRFRDQSSGWRAGWTTAPITWNNALASRVEDFQGSRTRDAKQRWFRCERFSDFSFLEDINLPSRDKAGSGGDCASAAATVEPVLVPPASKIDVPTTTAVPGTAPAIDFTDLKQFLDAFLEAWMVKADDARLLDWFVDPGSVVRAMATRSGAPAVAKADERKFALAVLSMWRILDHGLVEHLGHGTTPDASLEKLGALGQNSLLRKTYNTVAEVTVPIAGCQDRFMIIDNKHVGPLHDVTAVTRLKHAPDDTLMIRVVRDAQRRWWVESVDSVVEH